MSMLSKMFDKYKGSLGGYIGGAIHNPLAATAGVFLGKNSSFGSGALKGHLGGSAMDIAGIGAVGLAGAGGAGSSAAGAGGGGSNLNLLSNFLPSTSSNTQPSYDSGFEDKQKMAQATAFQQAMDEEHKKRMKELQNKQYGY